MLTPPRVSQLAKGRRARTPEALATQHSREHQERGIILRPKDDPTLVIRSINDAVAFFFMHGTRHIRETITVDVPGVSLYGYGQAIFQRAEGFTGPMFHVTANDVLIDGLVLDDNAGTGPAVRFEGTTGGWISRLRILAGPGGGVALGTGIHLVNADECMVTRNRVEPSIPVRPLADIYLDDASTDCSLVANVCPGGVLSYLGVSGSVASGNVGTVVVR